MPTQFNIRKADNVAAARLSREVGLAPLVATTLVARGIDTPDAARAFLEPSLARDWANPLDIPGLSDVADVLEDAVRAHEHVVVFGDFDVDGITSTVVLTRGLRALGGHATPFVPLRFEEGYGLSAVAWERVKALKPDVVVTVDCGISNRSEVAAMLEDGVRVAITDHHEPGENIPKGVPVADPKLSDGCESGVLAGVGVALKLVQILGSRMGQPYLWRSYTDIAALGTVADLMPLIGENRALVADGLERMNAEMRPCVAALVGAANMTEAVTATNLSFTLVPRLNAAGRMGDARPALDLLLSDSFDEACALAESLEEINDRRRAIEADLSAAAEQQAREIYHGQRVLVLSGRGWHEGVKGIAAGRLARSYGVPTLLFTINGDEARGSGRSVGSVNLFAAVESASDLLTRFGGHAAAVGVTLPVENIEAFTERLCAYMDELDESAFHPKLDVDACIDLGDATLEAARALRALEPFGQDNPEPVFLARNVTLRNVRAVGANKNHLSCKLTNGLVDVGAVMFNCSQIDDLLCSDSVLDAAFALGVNEWRGECSARAMIEALEPARMCAGLQACLDPDASQFCEGLFAQEAQGASLQDASAHDPSQDDASQDDAAQDASRGPAHDDARVERRARWEACAHKDPNALQASIVSAIIGDGTLLSSQSEVLAHLRQGASTLAVMATGRGKSLTFQVFAIMRALCAHEASVFVYPLRALIADQAFHLSNVLDAFGLACSVLTGESTQDERKRVYDGLAGGDVDIVLTTPEYLVCHVDDIAACGRIGFVVVDEAHHIGLAKAAHRSAYRQLGAIIARFGQPTVLAATATAPEEVALDIDDTLPLQDSVLDDAPRDNLTLDDQRGIKDRVVYLARIIATGEKTVVYVNSREQSVALARALRRRVPQIAPMIGFYNAGLTREERCRVEELFRCDKLVVLVATSAFGEGVNIANIRHVVLYHMPFNEVEFNQMSGRCGRDGEPACVHLLFGREDASLNERILAGLAPDHDTMAQMYRRLRACQRQAHDNFFAIDDETLARQSSSRLCTVTSEVASCALAVFQELGLIEVEPAPASDGQAFLIHVNEHAPQVELCDSVRYCEGQQERADLDDFCKWVMSCDGAGLVAKISHPIVPDRPGGAQEPSDGASGEAAGADACAKEVSSHGRQ